MFPPKLLPLFLLLILSNCIISNNLDDSLEARIENYIIKDKIDSAKALLKEYDLDQTSYLNTIIEESPKDYKNLNFFLNKVRSRHQADFEKLNKYISNRLTNPNESSEFNLEYVDLLFNHISNLRNNNELDESNEFHQKMLNYLESFDGGRNELQRAKALSLVHSMVLNQIQNKYEASEKYGLEILEIGKSIDDTLVLIMGYYHIYDTYAGMRNLEKSIESAEELHRLEELLSNHSPYYYENLFHLVDLYDYMDKNSNKIPPLLFKLYKNKSTKNKSYELLARHFRGVKEDSVKTRNLYNLLEVKSILEFSELAVNETDGTLFEYDRIYLLRELASMLSQFGYMNESNVLMNKTVTLTRNFYSKELSQSLAKYEGDLIRKEKEVEVKAEKEKVKTYALVMILIALLFITTSFGFIRVKKQKGVLEKKNIEIEKQRAAIQERDHEKALLLKEVHHRVKNNFQIISSLLELQSKGIEDEKARELAQEGKNRIKSMSLIHQKLYQNDDLLIYFDDYINNLVKEISDMYGDEKDTTISVQVPEIAFDIDTAIPLGLIVNELITNAMKYGGAIKDSQIDVSIQKQNEEGDFELIVKDNGVGMPADFDIFKAKSLGLRLIKSLSKQLHGKASYFNESGAVFKVVFKNSSARKMLL